MSKINSEVGEQTRKTILKFITSYIQWHGYSPSVREICAGVHLLSSSSVHNHLQKMMELGMIETDADPGSSRAIRVPGYKFVKDIDMVDDKSCR